MILVIGRLSMCMQYVQRAEGVLDAEIDKTAYE